MKDMKQLEGKLALVTGGSRGIGAAITQRLARDGAAVALTYVSAAEKAQAVAKQIDAGGGRVLVIQADSADPGAVIAAVEHTVRDLGRIDILVNNAGIFTGGPLEEMTVDQVDRILAIDVRAVFLAAQASARHRRAGGASARGRRPQGHGHTGDVDRPLSYQQMADDTGLGAAARALRGAQPGRDALILQIPGDGSVRHLPCSTGL
jgi:NAD(P)-dependent dehydrogenase (short-subunit alcohol dehydrogenase family)